MASVDEAAPAGSPRARALTAVLVARDLPRAGKLPRTAARAALAGLLAAALNCQAGYAGPGGHSDEIGRPMPPGTLLEQVAADAVATHCTATDRGYQLKIFASNASNTEYHCVSICYYRQSRAGFTGHWQSDYVVPRQVKDVAVATLKRDHPMTVTGGVKTHCSPG